MHPLITSLLILFLFLPADHPESGALFDKVAHVLEHRFYDADFREENLPGLIDQYRPLAKDARTLHQERKVVHAFLSEIPVSHLALLSRDTYDGLVHELWRRKAPTFGFQLKEHEGKFFAHAVLGGGPADEAGLRRWDRVRALDGVPVRKSARLDWRSDDAYLPDPAQHGLRCESGDPIELEVERSPGETFTLHIEARPFTSFESEGTRARLLHWKGKNYGYIHFWYITNRALPELLAKKCKDEFAEAHGLILDLRGRGGNATVIKKLVKVLKNRWHPRPLVVLVDRGTRSAKEILAYEIQKAWLGLIVGERTAGAVIPATFERVTEDAVLMYPSFTLGRHTDLLEGVGVKPDIHAADAGPYSEGADPILEAGLETLHRGIVKM